MDEKITFTYSYSAPMNKEVQEIRKKYLPREENKLEELKRLDYQVQTAGLMQSLTVGIVSGLVFGLGLCLAMQILPGSMLLGICLGLIGLSGMLFAYPVYRTIFDKTKAKLTPRILQLASDLVGEKN